MLLFKVALLIFLVVLNFLAISGISLGEKCDSNYYCWYIPNAECQNGICQCMGGTTSHQGSCLEDINPKKSCGDSGDCYLLGYDSICVEGYCRCPGFHNFRDGKCQTNRHLYAPCVNDKECYLGKQFVGSMICKNFACACNNGYYQENARCRNGSIKNINMPGLKYLLFSAIIALICV